MIFLIYLTTAFGSVSGTVYDAHTSEPLPLVNLTIVGTIYGTSTDSSGKFFMKFQPGNYTIKVMHIGYREKLINVKLSADEEMKLSIFLEKEAIKIDEVEVLGKRVIEPSFRAIEAEELKKIPFAELDFFRTIQALPGVGFMSDLIGWLYVRGGMPEENLYLMDGGEILCPHHYFGGVSAFNINLIEDVRFSCGGFSPCYGDRLSAVLDVRTRDGSTDRRKTFIEADLLEAGVEAEFPITSVGSYVFSARKNYFKTIAPLIGMKDRIVILPDFQNFQNKLSLSLTKNHKISLSILAMEDAASVSESMTPLITDSYHKNKGSTYVLNYHTTVAKQLMRTTVYHSFLDRGATWRGETNTKENKDTRLKKTGIKQEGEIRLWNNYCIGWGISNSYTDYYVNNTHPFELVGFDWRSDFIALTAEGSTSQYGGYLLMNAPLTEKITISLGVRGDNISLTDEKVLSPRIRLLYSLDSRTSFSIAWGDYRQFQAFEVLSLTPRLPSTLANHYVIGVERELCKDVKGWVELYEKRFSNLPFIDVEKITADNSGYGYARGVEMFLRKSFTGNFFGWISCAFSKSRRTGLFDKNITDFDADQPFILNLIGAYTFGKYTISTTYRHASGRPYTPIVGYIWIDDKWWYISGPRNSSRYPPYDRLDMRIERRFNISNTQMDLYFAMLNIFQHRNVQLYYHIYTARQPIYMLPRIAFLGIKFNF